MLNWHLFIVLLHFLLGLSDLWGRGICAQVNYLKPAIVSKSQHQARLVSHFKNVNEDRRTLSLGSPNKLHIFVNHQIVTERPKYVAKARRVMLPLKGSCRHILPLPIFCLVDILISRDMISLDARWRVFQSSLIPYSTIWFSQNKNGLLSHDHQVLF